MQVNSGMLSNKCIQFSRVVQIQSYAPPMPVKKQRSFDGSWLPDLYDTKQRVPTERHIFFALTMGGDVARVNTDYFLPAVWLKPSSTVSFMSSFLCAAASLAVCA